MLDMVTDVDHKIRNSSRYLNLTIVSCTAWNGEFRSKPT